MRRIRREVLNEAATDLLCRRTLQIANAAEGETRAASRAKARKAEARRLWKQEDTKAFEDLRAALRRMAPGNEHCMYCEYGLGSTIDHLWPKEKYPLRTFAWVNHLLACFDCNVVKGSKFPRDERGTPLLIDPTVDDPREHLDLSPSTGRLTARTRKGEETLRVLGFDRRPPLDRSRQDAWESVKVFVVRYANACRCGDTNIALYAQRILCRHPHGSLLLTLFDLLDAPRGAELVGAEVVTAVLEYPEIRTWLGVERGEE